MRWVKGNLIAMALAIAAMAAFTAVVRADGGGPVVVSDVQASTDPYGTSQPSPVQPNTEIEPSIAVNPADSSDVVTAFQEGRVDAGGDADNGFATSLDGGQTWTYANLPGLTKAAPDCPNSALAGCAFDRASDAVVTFGKDPSGKAFDGYFVYASSLVFDDTSQNGLPSGMAVNVSSDGGRTWSDAVILEQDSIGGLNDKNWILTDNGTGAGHHPGRVYVVWDRVDPVVYAYCDPDGAATAVNGTGCDKLGNWSNVQGNGFYTLFPGQGIGTMPVVLDDGSLGVMFNSLTSNPCPPPPAPTDQPQCNVNNVGGYNIEFGVIPGAGSVVWPAPFPATTWAPVTVAQYESNGVSNQRAGSLPQVAIDPGRNEVYITWEDNRFRTDGGATAGSGASNQNDVLIATSTPATPGAEPGLTWAAPVRVNPGPTDDYIDRYNPAIAVGQDGILRVAYRQRDENPSTYDPVHTPVSTWYQESSDGGQTFSAPLQVNVNPATVDNDPEFGAFSRGGLFEGDYEQLAAGGTDETYVTRDEAFAPSPGATCSTGFVTIPATPCQNQQTFVAHLVAQPASQTPDTRFVPGLLLAGGAGASLLFRRRRAGARLRSQG